MSASICRVIRDPKERSDAREIVRRMYAAQGYDTSNGHITRHLDTPQATTFGLFQENVLFGTISIVIDGEEGLPMDSIYASELARWRSEGKKLSEVVQFAMDHDTYYELTKKKPSPFEAAPLFAAVLSHAIRENVDYICISINPKHDRFYDLLGFKQIGELKHYDSVNAPAIARALSVSLWRENPILARFLSKEGKIIDEL